MILVDSSVWIDYFNGKITWQTEVFDQMLQQVPVCTGDLIIAEVLQGFRSDREFRKGCDHRHILHHRKHHASA